MWLAGLAPFDAKQIKSRQDDSRRFKGHERRQIRREQRCFVSDDYAEKNEVRQQAVTPASSVDFRSKPLLGLCVWFRRPQPRKESSNPQAIRVESATPLLPQRRLLVPDDAQRAQPMEDDEPDSQFPIDQDALSAEHENAAQRERVPHVAKGPRGDEPVGRQRPRGHDCGGDQGRPQIRVAPLNDSTPMAITV